MEPQSTNGNSSDVTLSPTGGLMGTLEYYFVQKAPFQLPQGLKDFLVSFGPWLIIISLLFAIPMILALLGITSKLGVLTAASYGYGWSLSSILLVVIIILQVIALPGLFAKKMSGWTLLFYSQVVSLLSGLLLGNIVGALFGMVIGFYILFQVRSRYS